jgi:hypothetical protein
LLQDEAEEVELTSGLPPFDWLGIHELWDEQKSEIEREKALEQIGRLCHTHSISGDDLACYLASGGCSSSSERVPLPRMKVTQFQQSDVQPVISGHSRGRDWR